MKTTLRSFGVCVVMVAAMTASLIAVPAEGAVLSLGKSNVSFLYKLSALSGVIPFASVRIFADKEHKEVYVMSGDGVSIFNSSGMETYRADYDPELGVLVDMTVDKDGNLIVLSIAGGDTIILVCNYRLEPVRKMELTKLPPEYAGFHPSAVKQRDGRLYFASDGQMKIVVTDLKGEFIKGYDIAAIVGTDLDEKTHRKGFEKTLEQLRTESGIAGFSVDDEGNMLFVLPVTARACRLTPDGEILQFGKRGSGPGKIGVPSAIVRDSDGNYLVADKLRRIILVYDKELNFITEFGSLGVRDAFMIGPNVMELGADGKLYVGQVARRGVNVYQISKSD